MELLKEKICPECKCELEPYIDDEMSCSCHIVAPCAKCCDERLVCPECGDIFYPYDFEPTPLERVVEKLIKTNSIPIPLSDFEIKEKIKSGEFKEYVLQHSNPSSFKIYSIYFSENEFKKKPSEIDKWIGIYVGRPNGFSKYDMVEIDVNIMDGIVKVRVSYCID